MDHFDKSITTMPDAESPARKIERMALRKLSIHTSLQDFLPNCHQQDQSPLYNTLPKEIRDLIFEHATAEYEDLENKYDETAFYYRPGFRGPHKTSTSLLLTCRRIWLETSALPMKQSSFTFWLSSARGPARQKGNIAGAISKNISERLTRLNMENFTSVHFFLQMFEAERMFHSGTHEQAMFVTLKPKNFRVTVRHTDWWFWEGDTALRFEDHWLQRILDAPFLSSVQKFSLELETLEKNKEQLQPIVDRLSNREGKLRPVAPDSDDMSQLKLDGPPHVWHWKGPANINGEEYEPYKQLNLTHLDYRVVVLTWKARKATATDRPTPSPHAGLESKGLRAGFHPALPVYRIHRQPPPRYARNSYMLRQRLLQGGWQHMRFPLANYSMKQLSDDTAQITSEEMRLRFTRMFADDKARDLEAEWRTKGSLLKFDERLPNDSVSQLV